MDAIMAVLKALERFGHQKQQSLEADLCIENIVTSGFSARRCSKVLSKSPPLPERCSVNMVHEV
jgi:hypothetical protein